ncbi:MAG: HyaD/HybD family hydrogenase maturation endopeptidase [Deltaproteobacteria bacterium]|nr:HyaD/HybD family hydrogenase maturation endopeptidase [Deltaproteobacteria bacterium]MBW2071015.1 HyaD/HybD family hydrogenase maturation endopeptidase [Deltaproteobacteria bacterium]
MFEGKIVILGVGNLLMSDEGVGIHAVQELMRRKLPAEVEVVDGGTSTLDLLPHLHKARRVIIIDVIKAGGEPGDIYRCRPEDLQENQEQPLSLHQVDFAHLMKMAELMGYQIGPAVIYGMEPAVIGWGMELSPIVAAKMPKLLELVLEEVSTHIENTP